MTDYEEEDCPPNIEYVTISLPKAIADDIDWLNEELGYWPSRGAFAREACLEKIRAERRELILRREEAES